MADATTGRSDIGIVLVGYRSGAQLLERAAVLAASGFEVRIVDNAGELPADAGVISPGSNLGFGSACNLAVAHLPASVTAVVFHNPDVEVTSDEIDRLVSELRDQSTPGLVSASERVPGEGLRNGYRYPSPMRELALALLASGPATSLGPLARRRSQGRRGSGRRPDPTLVFGSAALMAADRRRFELVGGFDTRFFLYAEDLDLWDRVLRSGADAVVSTVSVRHAVGTGSEASARRRELLRWLGVELFLEDRPILGSWRVARTAHRTALFLAGGPRDEVERAVSAHWQAGESPAEVQALLRPLLAGLVLVRPAPVAVDVVVTCHNYGQYLAEAMASVLGQTLSPASIAVVDDASDDDTQKVMEALVAAEPRVHARRAEKRVGVAAARNMGLAVGTAPYVCFLDADDRMPPEYLERLVGALQAGADIAFAPLRPFGPGSSSVRLVNGYDQDQQVVDNLINAAAVFRRELVLWSGGMSSTMDSLGFEDWDFWMRLIGRGARVAYVDSTFLEYRRHGTPSRNTAPFWRRTLARFVVWWRSRRQVRPKHVGRWVLSLVGRSVAIGRPG